MISLIAFLGTVLLGITVSENEITNAVPTEVDNSPLLVGTVHHSGFSSEDNRQLMVNRAYELGGIDFVAMIECENGNWNPHAVGDSGRSYGLCQMNNRWHNIPQEYYEDWKVQIDYCYQKWSTGTKFYGPSRKIKGQLCKDYVLNRFIINDERA